LRATINGGLSRSENRRASDVAMAIAALNGSALGMPRAPPANPHSIAREASLRIDISDIIY
jgi:hypothetical protein